MAAGRRRLRESALAESVATSSMPQLERGEDDEPTTAREDLERAIADFDGDADEALRLMDEAKRLEAESLLTEEIRSALKPKTEPKPKVKPKSKRKSQEAMRILVREAEVRRNGGAYEATIVREGPGNPNDRRYCTKQALQHGVTHRLFEGLQAYANHPSASEERDRPERDVRQLVGHFREARYEERGGVGHVVAQFVHIGGEGYGWVRSLIEAALSSPTDKPLIGQTRSTASSGCSRC